MSDNESFADKIRAKMQAQMKSEEPPPTPPPKPPELDIYFQEWEQRDTIGNALRNIKKALDAITLDALNVPPPQPQPLYTYFPHCGRCGDITPIEKYRDGLCKDCYIIRHGEWRRQ